MKMSRFTEEQVAYGLQQAAARTRAREVCRQMGIADAKLYVRKKSREQLDVPASYCRIWAGDICEIKTR